MASQKSQAPTPKTVSTGQPNQSLPTFLDHVHELRRRLFWVVAAVLVVSSVAYGFINQIIDILTYPLGNQRLFYLTPAGGLSFSIKLCVYTGILVAVPLIMYHLYRYLEPLMGQWRRSAIFYVGLSTSLAAAGVLFAYFVSLPGALHFLTNFNLDHIQAMLTVDSYLSFVLTYLLGAALLFQIPLLLLIINTMTPLKPSKLMKWQRYVIVAAFLIGAVISPTPDIMNQTFLALPVIAMYELGVVMVWLQNRSRLRKARKQSAAVVPVVQPIMADAIPLEALRELQRAPLSVQKQSLPVRPVTAQKQTAPVTRPAVRPARPMFNDIAPVSKVVQRPNGIRSAPTPHPVRPAPRINVPQRSVDGFVAYRPPAAA
ncbi:MAG TPA: twin-arginine translocase subunit TatC [Candidatus Saccharimonas sp.]|nr:twin-arginine translocase subunit TatC [Candidatus Saccharimonas sp.]